MPDGTVPTGKVYCTPLELELRRQNWANGLSFVALVAAALLSALAWLLFEDGQRRNARIAEAGVALLALVPLGFGFSQGWTLAVWAVLIVPLWVQEYRVTRREAEEARRAAELERIREMNYFGRERIALAIERLKSVDPRFSRVAFLDFATAVYHALHTWPGSAREPALGVFASARVRYAVCKSGRVDQVVVGAATLTQIQLLEELQTIRVKFDANYTRQVEGQAPVRVECLEEWCFERSPSARSPAPDKLRVLTCPSCGAPANITDAGICAHCSAVLQAGRETWFVSEVQVLRQQLFETQGLGETVPEAGTQLPTVLHPGLQEAGAQIAQGEFAPFFEAFQLNVVRPTFRAMYAAWTSLEWASVRHLMGDRLWESQAFWMEQYREKGLRNRVEKVKVKEVEAVRAEQDQDVEAITVRVYARGLDYTVDSEGKVTGGDAERPRGFSEYWVFVRSRGAKDRGRRHVDASCPNCGAPLDRMNAAGVCGYCEAKVTCGDHGWVLTQIIQDESYER